MYISFDAFFSQIFQPRTRYYVTGNFTRISTRMIRRETLYCSSRIHGAIFPPLFHHLLRLVPRVYSYISALMDRRHFRVNFRIPSLNEYLIYFLRVCNSWQVQLVDFPNISFVIINFQIWVSVLFQKEREMNISYRNWNYRILQVLFILSFSSFLVPLESHRSKKRRQDYQENNFPSFHHFKISRRELKKEKGKILPPSGSPLF